MGVLCAVYGCSNNSGREKDKKFFRIPKIIRNNDPRKTDEKLSIARRKLWLQNISREDLDEAKAEYTRVCCDHFISGKFCIYSSFKALKIYDKTTQIKHVTFLGQPSKLYDQNNPDWAPTQRMGHNKVKVTTPS